MELTGVKLRKNTVPIPGMLTLPVVSLVPLQVGVSDRLLDVIVRNERRQTTYRYWAVH